MAKTRSFNQNENHTTLIPGFFKFAFSRRWFQEDHNSLMSSNYPKILEKNRKNKFKSYSAVSWFKFMYPKWSGSKKSFSLIKFFTTLSSNTLRFWCLSLAVAITPPAAVTLVSSFAANIASLCAAVSVSNTDLFESVISSDTHCFLYWVKPLLGSYQNFILESN